MPGIQGLFFEFYILSLGKQIPLLTPKMLLFEITVSILVTSDSISQIQDFNILIPDSIVKAQGSNVGTPRPILGIAYPTFGTFCVILSEPRI